MSTQSEKMFRSILTIVSISLLLLSSRTINADEQMVQPSSLDGAEAMMHEVNGKTNSECHLRAVVHILQHPGCLPKPVASHACYGTCSSYVQLSSTKFWQLERLCNCCQEVGERETLVTLLCPRQAVPKREIVTRAPLECMCRPCSSLDHDQVRPLEIENV